MLDKLSSIKKKAGFIFQHVFKYHRGIFWFTFSLFSVDALFSFVQPYFFARLFNEALFESFSWGVLWKQSIPLIVITIVSVVVNAFAIRVDIDFLARFTKSLMYRVYSKLLYFDITLHENESSGKYLGKTTRAVNKIMIGVDQMLFLLLPASVQIIFVHVLFFYYSWQAGTWLTLSFILLVSFTLYVCYFMAKIFSSAFDQENKVSSYFAESLGLIRTIRYFGKEDHYDERGEEEFEKVVQIWRERLDRLTLYLGTKDFLLWTQGIVFTLLTIWQYRIGVLDREAGLFFLILVPLYIRSLHNLSRLIDKMAEFYSGVEQYYGAMEKEETVTDRKHPRAISSFVKGEVSFDDVTFRYAGNEYDQFGNFSVSFTPQKTTAIVGTSGAGKSTLVKLLFRLYDVQGGAVRLDGIDIREFDQREYRKLLAIVPQDVELFNASIRENILMGDGFTDEEIWQTLKLAVLEERVQKMPKGLDTEVGERGVKLSGGEKQRLGIARALIRKPKILVLDEATSSLDTLSERQVKQAIYNLEHLNITVIVIAHRLSTIQDADEILVFEEGEIVERGTHAELLEKKGKYFVLQGAQVCAL